MVSAISTTSMPARRVLGTGTGTALISKSPSSHFAFQNNAFETSSMGNQNHQPGRKLNWWDNGAAFTGASMDHPVNMAPVNKDPLDGQGSLDHGHFSNFMNSQHNKYHPLGAMNENMWGRRMQKEEWKEALVGWVRCQFCRRL